jgi:drug/metabolite transporter (DMT)-like permease
MILKMNLRSLLQIFGMYYLIGGILANVCIFLAFRTFPVFKIDNLQAIVVNYMVCVFIGLFRIDGMDALRTVEFSAAWTWVALLIGLMLVLGFYFATITAQKMGVSITSVASKVSLVLPVLFSLLVMKVDTREFSVFNYMGMMLAVISIYLGALRSRERSAAKLRGISVFLLPFAVFLFGGLIDISLNYSNHVLINTQNEQVFPIVLFGGAAVIGLIFMLFRARSFGWNSLLGGLALGICNYLSLVFVLNALTAFQNNGAVFFPIYNIGIILLSSLLAIVIFREKLSKTNFVGLGLSVVALLLLSYQELMAYF